ncbi:MAG: hypothetical protein Q9191_006205 [Dirinaria sp. TL-2023a]
MNHADATLPRDAAFESNAGTLSNRLASQKAQKHESHTKTRTGRSRKVLVYDCAKETMGVESEENIHNKFKEHSTMQLPRGSEVTVFVDSKSRPTTENTAPSGHSNDMLIQLHLNRLRPWPKVLRFLGRLDKLYVLNAGPLSDDGSSLDQRQR